MTAELVQRHAPSGRGGRALGRGVPGGEGAEVLEVVVADAGVEDASRLSEVAPRARVVSLPFNLLKGDGRFLVPVAATLEYVDLSHNQLGSLRALAEAAAGFPKLRVLRLGGNRFRDVLALTAVPDLGCLEEVWLQGNKLESVGQLCAALRGVTSLRRLAVAENPFQNPQGAAYRAALAAALPWLENVDGAPVTDEERSGVVRQAEEAGARAGRGEGAGAPRAAARGARRGMWEVLDSRGNVVQKAQNGGPRSNEQGGAATSSARVRTGREGAGQPPSSRQARSGRGGSGGKGAAPAPERVPLPLVPRSGAPRGPRVPGVIKGAAPRQRRELDPEKVAAKKALEEEMRRRIFGGPPAGEDKSSSPARGQPEFSEGEGEGERNAEASGVAVVDPLSTLPFDLPPAQAEVNAAARARARAEAKKRQEDKERLRRANQLVQQAADGAQSLQLRYPRRARGDGDEKVVRGALGPAAVLVRPDGSAVAKWPNGALAVSVDPETAATTCKASIGGRGGSTASSDAALMGVQQPKGTMYRVYASHREGGGIAVSMDAKGRHCTINYPSSQVCLSVSPETGGVMIAEDGELLASWFPEDLVVDAREGAEACGDDATVGGRVSEHLAFTYRLPREPGAKGAAGAGELQLYFACSGVRYRFCSRGANQRALQWAPTYSAGDPSRPPLSTLTANAGRSGDVLTGTVPDFCERLAEENAVRGGSYDAMDYTDADEDDASNGDGAASLIPAFSSVGGESLAPRLGDISSIISGLDSFFSKAS